MSSRSDIGPRGVPVDRRPTSPLLSEAGLRSAAESYLHFRSHSRAGSNPSVLGSDATPTPSASALRKAQALVANDNSSVVSSSSKLSSLLHNLQPNSRHGSNSNSTTHLAQPFTKNHSRSDSGMAGTGSGATSPLPSHAKLMTPSSTSSTLRAPYGGAGPSSMTLASSSGSSLGVEKDNVWGALHVHVLPLFNSEALRVPIEDLNTLVKKHMANTVSRNPQKAISQLEGDVSELITTGMVTLNSKLASGVGEDKLVQRIVEMWVFFWVQILPYVEGVFLPLQTDPYLYSLSRSARPGTASAAVELSTAPSIDVRKLALRAFRDSAVLPVAPRLQKRFSNPASNAELSEYQRSRLEQMLLVLSSIASHSVSLSSTTLDNLQSVTPSERAVTTLLRLILYPPGTHPNPIGANPAIGPRLPSFLSGGAPRDRRGRLGRKSLSISAKNPSHDSTDRLATGEISGTDATYDLHDEREREGKELLDSLRSPNLDAYAESGGPVQKEDYADERSNLERHLGEEEEDAAAGTVMPNDALESLGTGPGGWGAAAGAGRRAAIYDDSGGDSGYEAGDGQGFVAGMLAGPRRPSRAGLESERETPAAQVERKTRI